MKWMPTTSLHGAKAVRQASKTVRCFVRRIIEPKEIDRKVTIKKLNVNMINVYKNSRQQKDKSKFFLARYSEDRALDERTTLWYCKS